MRKNILKYIGVLALILAAAMPSKTSAQVVNGGFETGDISSWSTNGNASAVTGFNEQSWLVSPADGYMARVEPISDTRSATESFLGLSDGFLTSVNAGVFNASTNYGSIKQSVYLNAFQTVTVYWNYVSQDYAPFNDGVFATMSGPSFQQAQLLAVTADNFGQSSVMVTGSYGSTGWHTVSFTATAAGTYTLGIGCFNALDPVLHPLLFVDNAAGGTSAPGQPVITTAAATNITNNSAETGGDVTSDGGAPVTARGVVYNTAPVPTLSNNFTTDGSGTGSFISNLAGLMSGTTYYVRAYATNTAGTSYGNEITFNTPAGCLAPSFTTCPANTTVSNTPGSCSGVAFYNVAVAGTTPSLSYTLSGATTGSGSGNGSGTAFTTGTTNVSITADNTCGSANCSFTVTVNDTELPTIAAPVAVSVSADAGSCSATNVALGTATFADNCAGSTVSNNAPASFPIGSTVVTYTVTDAAGLQATATQTVTVTDNENPTITAPATVTVSADAGSCAATNVVLGSTTFTDNCAGATVTNDAPASFPMGNTTVTYTVTDAAGLQATATQTVTVTDNEAPQLVGVPADVTASCDAIPPVATVTATDNCGAATVSSFSFPTINAQSTNLWKAENNTNDAIGGATATNTLGTINYSSGISGSTGFSFDGSTGLSPGVAAPVSGTGDFSVSAWIRTSSTGRMTVIQQRDGDVMGQYILKIGTNHDGSWSIPGQVYFGVGGSAGFNHINTTNTVNDGQWHHVAGERIGTAISIYVDGVLSASGNTPGLVNMNQSGAINTFIGYDQRNILFNTPANFFVGEMDDVRIMSAASCSSNYEKNYAWVATDANNNSSAIATQTVTVQDATGPSLNVPANIAVTNDAGQCGANVNFAATATDNCGTATITYSQQPNTLFGLGTTTVIVSATDNCGNISTGSFDVTVTDNENPSITAPATVTVSADAGSCSATNIALGSATFADNCAGSTVSNDAPASFSIGSTVVTYTVTDAAGLQATATQTVTVTDNENPTITAPMAITTTADAGLCSASNVDLGSATFADNCTGTTVTNDAPASFAVGNTVVTYTATDASGNTATATQSVTVTDNQNPTITAPANIVINNYCQAVSDVALGDAATADNCGVASVTNDAPTSFPVGTTTITWTVTDINGNIASTTQNVTVVPATITVTAATTNNVCNAGTSGAINLTVNGTGTAPYTFSWNNGATTEDISGLAAGTYDVTVTDSHSCSATGSFTITEPAATGVSAIVNNVACNGQNNGSIDVTITSGAAPYTYNWGGGITTQDRTNLAPGTYTLVVTNGIGCTVTHTYTITQPAVLGISGTATDVTCYGNHDGAIDVTVTGGTEPYTYKWADVNQNTLILWMIFYFNSWCNNNTNWPGSTLNVQDRSGLYPGYYYVKATDANGCKAQTNFTIDQDPPLSVSNCKSNVTCNGGANGSIDISVCGGGAPYTYAWSNGATTQDVSGLSAGTYSVTVTDANGCAQVETVTITQPAPLTASIGVSPMYPVPGQQAYTIYLGYGAQTVTLQGGATGGNGNYDYDWAHTNSGNNCVNVTPTSTMVYNLTVTDHKGCSATAMRTIIVKNAKASNNKINVCHNGVVTAVSQGQVQGHLNHGDVLGSCANANAKSIGNDEDAEDHHEVIKEAMEFNIYPNPSNGTFTIQLPQLGNTEVIITDVAGKVIERRIIKDNNARTVEFALGDIARGMYMVKVINAGQVYQSKITLQ